MQKKLLKIILIGLLLSSLPGKAQTVIPVVWGFGLSSSQGLMIKEIINEANLTQDKYQFVFDYKPGAGGSLAVRHAMTTEKPMLLAHTSSFFIRPYMSFQGSYDPESFTLLNNFCSNQPLALISKKYKSLQQLPNHQSFTVGIIQGSVTQIVMATYQRSKPHMTFIGVGFKSTPEITTAVLGNHIDLGIDFLSNVVAYPDINVLAITGTKNHDHFLTFASQGLTGFDNIVNSYYILINSNINPTVTQELNDIIRKSVRSHSVQKLCAQDFGTQSDTTGTAAKKLLMQQNIFWREAVELLPK